MSDGAVGFVWIKCICSYFIKYKRIVISLISSILLWFYCKLFIFVLVFSLFDVYFFLLFFSLDCFFFLICTTGMFHNSRDFVLKSFVSTCAILFTVYNFLFYLESFSLSFCDSFRNRFHFKHTHRQNQVKTSFAMLTAFKIKWKCLSNSIELTWFVCIEYTFTISKLFHFKVFSTTHNTRQRAIFIWENPSFHRFTFNIIVCTVCSLFFSGLTM